jgi:hypothetical protein
MHVEFLHRLYVARGSITCQICKCLLSYYQNNDTHLVFSMLNIIKKNPIQFKFILLLLDICGCTSTKKEAIAYYKQFTHIPNICVHWKWILIRLNVLFIEWVRWKQHWFNFIYTVCGVESPIFYLPWANK